MSAQNLIAPTRAPLRSNYYFPWDFEAGDGTFYAMEADTQMNSLSFEITWHAFYFYFLLLSLYCCIIIHVTECISNYFHNLHPLFELSGSGIYVPTDFLFLF